MLLLKWSYLLKISIFKEKNFELIFGNWRDFNDELYGVNLIIYVIFKGMEIKMIYLIIVVGIFWEIVF